MSKWPRVDPGLLTQELNPKTYRKVDVARDEGELDPSLQLAEEPPGSSVLQLSLML